LEDFADASDAGDTRVEAAVQVTVGLKLTQFGQIAADGAFGMVTNALDVGAAGVLQGFAALETPVGADDLRDE
jgi:hypothetical protein